LEQKVSFKADQLVPKLQGIMTYWENNIREASSNAKNKLYIRSWNDIYYYIIDMFGYEYAEDIQWTAIRRQLQWALIPVTNNYHSDSKIKHTQYLTLMKYVEKADKYMEDSDNYDLDIVETPKDDSEVYDKEYLESVIPGWKDLDERSRGKALAALTNSRNIPF